MELYGGLSGKGSESEKENTKAQLRSCRLGKRVSVDGPDEDEPLQACKKIKMQQESLKAANPVALHRNSSGHRIGSCSHDLKSWSQCNLGLGLGFKGSRSEAASQRRLPRKETSVQPERLEREVGKLGGRIGELVSPLSGPLGLTIKVHRHGRATDVSENRDTNAVSAGSFASVGRFSLVGKSSRGDVSLETASVGSASVVRRDSQPALEATVGQKTVSRLSQFMNVCPTAGQSANVGVLAEPVLAPNAAVSEKLRPLSRSTAKEDTQATAPLPVRRSSRNRGVSDDPDKEPNRSLSQLSNEEISPPSVKRTLGAKTTRSSDPCDAGKTSINVEEQWDLPSKSHEGEDVPSTSGSNAEKLPTKRSRGRPRVSSSEAVEESSWSNPKALKKKIQANRSSIGSLQPASGPTKLRTGERDNFVKLNINGRGGRRKFTNGIRAKRPSVYGRRKTFKRYKKTSQDDGEPVIDEGDNNVDTTVGPSIRKPVMKNQNGVDACGASTLGRSLWVDEGWFNKSVSTEIAATSCPVPVEKSPEDLERCKEAANKALLDPTEENLSFILKRVFGHETFRQGQLVAIQRVLARKSTLLVLPTGAGKSLSYQLPAYILTGLTLVISPLVALMADQLQKLPPLLPGGLINSSQTASESTEIMSKVISGHIKVLFISPERLFSETFLTAMDSLPEISLAVVDEAHCLSEWSHNFRPSYYRLGKILKQRLSVPCLLALTATATKDTECSITKALSIPSSGILEASCVRHNLRLSVSRSSHRRKDLLLLLQSIPFSDIKSIIIYCTYQAEADDISRYLEENKIAAKSYHSGVSSSERTRVYQLFCHNKLRVVVATVAFGMGLDKSDVGSVIHYNMPRSLEHYVQETGRAGRDGKAAFCHLFLDDTDYLKLRSLAHSDGADTFAVNKFLCRVFQSPPDASKSMTSINVEQTATELDLKEEVMATILSFMEVGDVQYVHVHSKLKATCNLTFYATSAALLAKHSALVATVIQKCQPKNGNYTFQVPAIANDAGLSLLQVQQELQRLQSAGEIAYELQDLAFCFSVLEVPDDICALTSSISARLSEVERCKVAKLDAMYTAAAAATALSSEDKNVGSVCTDQQLSLQSCIATYFSKNQDDLINQSVPSIVESTSSFLKADIKVFLKTHENKNFNGRAVARIFHGLWSPAYPYAAWCKNHFWGRYSKTCFHAVREAATSEILDQRSRRKVAESQD
ncbi:ATP-dependent DNA helicase Q-like 5 [Physcomitrium patens]|uniref:DNA 3'-5' helicase n=1 Tax=Physcomitrium patens TaxID=3218 RepID=A0A2K1JTK6_PHYPA|nr:ATP-dependent DNA helicase Q-like 5 [Physcomitrium patens]PNR44826.1 hypothetical protein PHYPA_014596 [Physcomitrium patens]|eukprot:XP_024388003.1 ATP-dependent DNA helicase Q-like 5 [Physcomitrella patens]